MAILTISREYGSGGRELGYAVSDLMDYEYIDKETIFKDIKEEGKKWIEWGEFIDEHNPSLWERYDWSFQGWVALMQYHILNQALKNNVVIMGRGSNFLLANVPYALRIRVKAPIEMRVKRIITRDSVDKKTARWLADKMDHERAGFIHSAYGKKVKDPKAYDMMINFSGKTIEETAKMLEIELKERDAFFDEDARYALEMKTLAAKIRSKILTDASFLLPIFDVRYEEGKIILTGVTHSPDERKSIEDAACGIAGKIPVKSLLHYRI